NSGFGRDLLKFPISKIPVQSIAHRHHALSMRGLTTVNEENVLQAIAVKIEKRYAAAHRLDQEAIFRRTAELPPVDSCCRGNIRENLLCARTALGMGALKENQ